VRASDPHHELAGDGDDAGQDDQRKRIGSQEQTERQARDERALRVEGGAPGQPVPRSLHQQDGGEDGDRVSGGQVELEPGDTVDEEAAERRDLVETGIKPTPGCTLPLRLSPSRPAHHAP
jgi:hypothetical protein